MIRVNTSKRALALCAAIPFFFLGGAWVPASAAEFPEASALQEAGVIGEGVSLDSLQPDHLMTQEEFLSLLARACLHPSAAPDGEAPAVPFQDWDQSSVQYRPYLSAAAGQGVAGGYRNESGGVSLLPKSVVSRSDAALYLGRALSLSQEGGLDCPDWESVPEYARGYASALVTLGLMDLDGGLFRPEAALTLKEAFTLAARAAEFQGKGTVSTVAGGQGGFSNGAWTESRFLFPESVASAARGLLAADTGNNLIRLLKDGSSSTLAGTIPGRDSHQNALGGLADGAAQSAYFSAPASVRETQDGQILVADAGNHAVRVIRSGRAYTLAGSGEGGYAEGRAELAQFRSPGGAAADKYGDVYVCDTLNHVIRKINSRGVTSLVAGVPGKAGYADGGKDQALFHEPTGIAIGEDGALYIADTGNQRIRVIRAGKTTTLAGGGQLTDPDTGYIQGGFQDGTGSQARFSFPRGLCLDGEGNLLIADSVNHRIRVLSQDGRVSTLAGNGNAGLVDGWAGASEFNTPTDVCVQDGKIYVADSLNSAIRCIELKKDS